jgi:ribonuclease P protein component
LEKQIRYTLKKDDRLKSRKVIEYLFKDGKTVNIFPLRIFYLLSTLTEENKTNKLQAGFSVSTRNFKKAVDRNRIKRLLRESYRLQKYILDKQLKTSDKNLSVFFVYNGNELPDYKTVYEKMQSGINRLQIFLNESGVTNI